MAVQIPFPLPAVGYALNSKVRINLDFLVDQFNQFNSGSATWDTVAIGTPNSLTGTLTFYNSSNANYLTFQPGVTGANTTYTFPITVPGASDTKFLTSTDAGIMSWTGIVGSIAGTTNQVNVADDGDGTVTLSTPQDIDSTATPTFANVAHSSLVGNKLLVINPSTKIIQERDMSTADYTITTTGYDSNFYPIPKLFSGNVNRVSITGDSNSFDFDLPQDIGTSSAVTFGSVAATSSLVTTCGINSGGTIKYNGSSHIGFTDTTYVSILVPTLEINGLTLEFNPTGGTFACKSPTTLTGGSYNFTFPAESGTNTYVLQTDGSGTTSWIDPTTFVPAGGASQALDNLTSVAINTSLISDTDNTDDLGDSTHDWKDIYFQGSLKSGAGALATATEVGYLTGVSSAIQTQFGDIQTQFGTKASLALDNLATVAINTSLISDTANTDDLGSSAIPWRNVVVKNACILQQTNAGTDYVALQAPATIGTSYSIIFPTDQGGANELLQNDGSGNLSWVTVSAAGGATTALDNLASVAINDHLIPDSDSDTNLGSTALPWATIYGRTVNAGSSGKSGAVSIYPGTASKGAISLSATDNAGDTITAITSASQAGARTYTIPDAGASASFVMTAGTNAATDFATGCTIGTLTLANGSITDSSGTINFGNENLVTAGQACGTNSTNAGNTVYRYVYNLDNTDTGSDARVLIRTGGTSSGDPYTQWSINGSTAWFMGIDNSDSDKLKIGTSVIGTSTAVEIDTIGAINQPLQPSFLVTANNQTDVTGDNTLYTVLWANEVTDANNDFASNVFTAPVSGQYLLSTKVFVSQLGTHTNGVLYLITSNRSYIASVSPGITATKGEVQITVITDMDASDTAYVQLQVAGSTKTVDISGGVNYNIFSGSLIN